MKNPITKLLLSILLLFSIVQTPAMEKFEKNFGKLSVTLSNQLLTVSNGRISRTWQIVPNGLSTVEVANLESGYHWTNRSFHPDWNYPGLTDTDARLCSIEARMDDDDQFTSEHMSTEVYISYPATDTQVKYVIWVYPDVCGVRTQLFIKSKVSKLQQDFTTGTVDRLPVDAIRLHRLYAGYYNDTQHRNTEETPLLKEWRSDKRRNECVDWANLIALAKGKNGIAMVKESHKCVNQSGVDTGDFQCLDDGAYNRGTALKPSEIDDREYRWCWASWSLVYTGGNTELELAVKQFDRMRYPINPAKDIYIQANTWGSDRGKFAANESNVLEEIASQADLGVDFQQIDSGWQCGDNAWTPDPAIYPQGWTNVRRKAAQAGVKLGIWGASMKIGLADLKKLYDEGGFINYKLDFASLGNRANIDTLIHKKVRPFILHTNHKVSVNWDLTENAPRFGYFWAKEYGCIYLENRKPRTPVNAIYVPHLVLRDYWHLAKYININKFQTTIQQVSSIDSLLSDARLYSQSYATAIGICGVPLLFMETHFLKNNERNELKSVLNVYKKVRHDMFNCFVFPIGDEPSNHSWSGFQYVGGQTGFFLVFRELENTQTQRKITVRFLAGKNVKLTNLMTGSFSTTHTDKQGTLMFEIPQTADFRFYKYEIIK